MSSPHDPHDPRFELERQDNLTLLALGERVDDQFDSHRRSCAICERELGELSSTVQLARGTSDLRHELDAVPPPSVWAGIEAAVTRPAVESTPRHAADRPSGPGVTTVVPLAGRTSRRKRWIAAAVAVAAAVVVASGAGYALGRHTSGADQVTAKATLAHQPGGPDAVSGTASVIRTDNGLSLRVHTDNLPLRQGYYAVWVYDPAINHMINVGALDPRGDGQFAIPAGVDVHAYDVVDVSAQDFDGNPVHKQSVLRGGLTQ